MIAGMIGGFGGGYGVVAHCGCGSIIIQGSHRGGRQLSDRGYVRQGVPLKRGCLENRRPNG